MSAWRRPPTNACSCARSSRVCPSGSTACLLAYSQPPANGCPARLRACVGVVEPCTRGVSVGIRCMLNAPLGAGATLVMVHLDRLEDGGEPESYARCLLRCRAASTF